VDKVAFNKLSVELQVKEVNAGIKEMGSLRGFCMAIGVSKSTILSRFKKDGVVKEGDNYLIGKKVAPARNDVGEQSPKGHEVSSSIQADFGSEISLLNESELSIRNAIKDIAVSFVKVGYELKQIKDKKLYLYSDKIYSSVFEYALSVLHIRQSTVYNLIGVYNNFGSDGDKLTLKKEYSDFSYSQLSEMLSLPSEVLEDIKSTDSVRDIKDKKKKSKKEKSEQSTSLEDDYEQIAVDVSVEKKDDDKINLVLSRLQVIEIVHNLRDSMRLTNDEKAIKALNDAMDILKCSLL